MALSQKPISSPFNARTEAGEVVASLDLRCKTAIVTGASAGLGVEAVRALTRAGAQVVMQCVHAKRARPSWPNFALEGFRLDPR